MRPTLLVGRETLIVLMRKVLIANRGEIALRVIQACHELDLLAVAVYSTADRSCRHVEEADEAVCIGPPAAHASYLNTKNILAAAQIVNADAVHPGYGFLAENADFAAAVEAAGMAFVGPTPATIRALGDKVGARRIAREAGVPIIPGTLGAVSSVDEIAAFARQAGYPLLLKAAAGGGGRGMRIVESPEQLAGQLAAARQEANAAFSSGAIYAERLLRNARHVEVQVFGDGRGEVVSFGDRECSIQRRHQKLIEESPAPGLPGELRVEMSSAARQLATRLRYRNAGTVEFLVEEGRYYFIEVNTRVQVEHPVTEWTTGVDLVKSQLRCAAGEPLAMQSLEPKGHAIECRINAENPRTFVPCPGTIDRLRWPCGAFVRVDSHAYEGYYFPPFYDSLLAKISVWGSSRLEALARMSRALHELRIEGIETTVDLVREVVADSLFRAGRIDTGFLSAFLARTER